MNHQLSPDTTTTAGTTATHRVMVVILAVILAIAVGVSIFRAYHDVAGTDFPELYRAGQHVLATGQRNPDTILHRYLPSVDIALASIAWMPLPEAAAIFALFTVGAWVALLYLVERELLARLNPLRRRSALLVAALLTIVYTADHIMLGSFHILMLVLMLAGVARAVRGRTVSGTILLGLAVWLKLLPVVGVGYLLLKRRWTAAVGALVLAGLLNILLCVGVYGPRQTIDTHHRWWQTRAVGDVSTILTSNVYGSQLRDKNQSIPAVLRRILREPPVKGDGSERPWADVNIASLTGQQLRITYIVLMCLMLGALAWYWRIPAKRLVDARPVQPDTVPLPDAASTCPPLPRLAHELAVVCLAVMWCSPIVFSYYPTAMLPAFAVLLARLDRRPRIQAAVIAAGILAAVLLGIPAARAAGEILWTSVILAIACVWSTRPSTPSSLPNTS